MRKFLFFLVLLVSFSACNKSNQIRNDVLQLRSEKMNLDICYDEFQDSIVADWKLVLYTDSTECNSCKTNDFIYWPPVLNEFHKRGVSVVFIFHPRHRDLVGFGHFDS